MWVLLFLSLIPIGISIWSEFKRARKTTALSSTFKKSGDKVIFQLDTAVSQLQRTTKMVQKMQQGEIVNLSLYNIIKLKIGLEEYEIHNVVDWTGDESEIIGEYKKRTKKYEFSYQGKTESLSQSIQKKKEDNIGKVLEDRSKMPYFEDSNRFRITNPL